MAAILRSLGQVLRIPAWSLSGTFSEPFPQAAKAALDACLLSEGDMACGQEAWAALPDPYAALWEACARGVAEMKEQHLENHVPTHEERIARHRMRLREIEQSQRVAVEA